FGAYQRMSGFEVTDDASASADVVQVSSQLSGTVAQIFVNDNDSVKKGQLLATLDDSRVKILVQQAQANLDSALADAKGAG
ncbi:secretion protein HlyD, partial [Pseudomonas sp. FW305-47B]|uniref:biotin/lipoyl-binding protein n=1 Tax=Pseudomonas sp. FW305-47B TaxID=2070558 RepID=UPI000CC39AC5